MSIDNIRFNFDEAQRVLKEFTDDPENFQQIFVAGEMLVSCLINGNKIISCGNGGSMSDAMHFAEEFTGRFRDDRRPLRCVAISDPAYLSCVANDFGYKQVFARYVEAFGDKDDVLVAISTSGNSPNVLEAAKMARKKGMQVIGLTGKGGGAMSGLCHVEIRAPHTDYSDRAQEIHIKVLHTLVDFVEFNL